jgi:hypothetical protein
VEEITNKFRFLFLIDTKSKLNMKKASEGNATGNATAKANQTIIAA